MATIENEKALRIRVLRERRLRLAEEKENLRKRTESGYIVVEKINAAFGSNLVLDDFDFSGILPVEFNRHANFRDCSGLVAAYSSEAAIRKIAACCDRNLGSMSGALGFDEYVFVGTARVNAVTVTALVDIAKAVHDSVLFCPEKYDSIILVDHYAAGGVPHDEEFSLIVQGKRLENEYAECFSGSMSSD